MTVSLHAKINHTEFEDKFLIKPMRTLNIFCRKPLKEFSNTQGKNTERLPAKVWNDRFNRTLHQAVGCYVLFFLVLPDRVQT